MNYHFKKFVALLMTLLMVLNIAPISAFAGGRIEIPGGAGGLGLDLTNAHFDKDEIANFQITLEGEFDLSNEGYYLVVNHPDGGDKYKAYRITTPGKYLVRTIDEGEPIVIMKRAVGDEDPTSQDVHNEVFVCFGGDSSATGTYNGVYGSYDRATSTANIAVIDDESGLTDYVILDREIGGKIY
jgi:hypothetical protein